LELESLRQSQIHFSLSDSKLYGRPTKGDQEIDQKNWNADTSVMPTLYVLSNGYLGSTIWHSNPRRQWRE